LYKVLLENCTILEKPIEKSNKSTGENSEVAADGHAALKFGRCFGLFSQSTSSVPVH